MSGRMFNGSTLTFGSSIGRLVGLQYRANGEVVDVTEPDDLTKMCEVAVPDLELTANVKRFPTVLVGATATPVVNLNDGSTMPISGTWAVTSIDGGGVWNAVITGSFTMKPTPEA